jgi:zinc protease
MTPDKKNVPTGEAKRFRLKNGATLLVKEDPSTPVVSLNIWIEAGSIDERPNERGMAHLIEHMIFKGTKARGVGEISRQVEAAGGYLNAFTSFEHTCFYVVLPSAQIQKALEIEFDAYLNSTFDAKELAKEKEVVFEEMRMRQDDPWSWSWEILFRILFKRNPYHWPVIGDMKILREVPRESLMNYYKRHYVPSNTVIAVVGNVQAPRILEWVRKNFERHSFPKAPQRKFLADPEPRGLQLHVQSGEVQQIYLSMGFPSVPLNHPDSASLEILAALLGDGPASRFNLALREKSQSVDDVMAEYFSGKYGGAVVFQALTDKGRLEACVGELMAAAKGTFTREIPADELQKVKNKVKASKIFEKQNMDGQAKNLGFWELQGGYELEDKFLRELDLVQPENIKRVGEKYIQPRRATMVVYHPKSQKVKGDAAYWGAVLEKGMASVSLPARPQSTAGGKIRKLALRDGSSLWVKERKNLPLVSMGVFVKGGFSDEPKGQEGITALMARCLQKGTRGKSFEKFSNEIESHAAHLDTSMEKDYWYSTLDVLKPDFEASLELMLESFREPAFSLAEVEKEKKMQLSTIARLKDDPAEYALLQSDVLTFGQGPYAHMPLGTAKSIAGISARDIRQWHQGYLSAGKLTWIAVGDIDPLRLKNILDEKFAGGVRKKSASSTVKGPTGPLKAATMRLASDNQQAHLVLGFKAPAFHAGDYFAFRVMNTLLNGMGGRLFSELREKRSLAYSVFASHDAGILGGIYQIYIGCAPAKVEEAKREMLKVIDDAVKGSFSGAEVERAKTYMIGLYQVGFQSNRSQVHSYARYELSGFGAPWVEKFPELIRKVTLHDIQRAAKKYLETENKTWVYLTPRAKGK